jgi:oligosaccharide translocation protein RFT1
VTLRLQKYVTMAAATNEASQEQPPTASNNLARRAAVGTLATLFLRLISFACTQWTFRILDPATLGRAVRLELLHATAIFLSREGFRLALTRSSSSHSEICNWNVAWLTLPVVTIVSMIAAAWHLLLSPTAQDDVDYRRAGVLYCAASTLEGWAEPAVLSALREMNVAIKASAEGLATVGKTVATLAFMKYLENQPVTAFGLAQIVYSVIYISFMYAFTYKTLVGPRWTTLDGRTCYMTVVFTVQGLFKHLLTEGDKIVLSTLSNSYDQGVYAMGSSYGSLAARVLLQPIEENSRLLWSRQSSQPGAPRLVPDQESPNVLDPLFESYTVLVKLVLYIGFIFGCLATNYTSILLGLLAGRKWGDNIEAAAVLSAFCIYTAFMAWNGATEAFVYGVASTASDMGRLGVAHTIVGLGFCAIAPVAISRYGTVGLVAANCLAMLFRSFYSVRFAAVYFVNRWQQKETSFAVRNTLRSLISRMFPHGLVILCFLACYLGTKASLDRFVEEVAERQVQTASSAWLHLAGKHVAVGATLGIGLLTTAYQVEWNFLSQLRKLWRGRGD